MSEKNCLSCRFLVSLSPTEKQIYRQKLTDQGLQGHFFGACTYVDPSTNFIVNRYLKYPVKACPYYQEGFFEETIGLPCPQCQQGDIVIRRPGKNGRTLIIIGCSLYPECKYTVSNLRLHKPCRYCNVPLVLNAGEQLICSCPQCKRHGSIPLTVQSRPHIFTINDKCIHNSVEDECFTCQRSINERQNLVDVELDQVVIHTYELMQHEANNSDRQDTWITQRHHGSSNFEGKDYIFSRSTQSNFQDDDYQEERELLYQELDSYSEDWARSKEDGWFYSE